MAAFVAGRTADAKLFETRKPIVSKLCINLKKFSASRFFLGRWDTVLGRQTECWKHPPKNSRDSRENRRDSGVVIVARAALSIYRCVVLSVLGDLPEVLKTSSNGWIICGEGRV